MQRAKDRTLCGICNNLYDKEVGLGVHVYVREKTDTNPGRDIKKWHHRLPPGRDLIGEKCNGNFLLDIHLVLLKVILYECINYSKYKYNLPVKKLI